MQQPTPPSTPCSTVLLSPSSMPVSSTAATFHPSTLPLTSGSYILTTSSPSQSSTPTPILPKAPLLLSPSPIISPPLQAATDQAHPQQLFVTLPALAGNSTPNPPNNKQQTIVTQQPITLLPQDISKLVSFGTIYAHQQPTASSMPPPVQSSIAVSATPASVTSSLANSSSLLSTNLHSSNNVYKNSTLARLLQQASTISSNVSNRLVGDWAEIAGVSGTGGGRCCVLDADKTNSSNTPGATSANLKLYSSPDKSTTNVNNLNKGRCNSPLVCLVLDD